MLWRSLILITMFGLLIGCGFKGPLVLPPASKNSSMPAQASSKPIENTVANSVESMTVESGNNFEAKSY